MSERLDWTMQTHIGEGYANRMSEQLEQAVSKRIAALEAELKATQEAGKRDFDAFQRTLHEWHALSQVADELETVLADVLKARYPTGAQKQRGWETLARYHALK